MNILLTVRRGYYGHDDYGVVLDRAQLERLKGLGRVFEYPAIKTSEELSRALAETCAEVMITFWGSPKVTMEVHRANPGLKYLCHVAGGVGGVVDREVIAEGLLVTNWGRLIAHTVAEGALMMILSALRRTTAIQFAIHRRGEWPRMDEVRPESLFGRRIGLHGLGVIAQELVKLLRPFGCGLSAYSPHCPDEVFRELGVRRVDSLEALYAESDVISLHASKTDANYHVVNRDILARVRDGAVLVNTARGAVIDTEALVEELKRGRIHAALDVFEQEPLPADHPLRGLENCQLISHMAGPTPDRRRLFGELAVDQVARYARGEPLVHAVTAEKSDLMT